MSIHLRLSWTWFLGLLVQVGQRYWSGSGTMTENVGKVSFEKEFRPRRERTGIVGGRHYSTVRSEDLFWLLQTGLCSACVHPLCCPDFEVKKNRLRPWNGMSGQSPKCWMLHYVVDTGTWQFFGESMERRKGGEGEVPQEVWISCGNDD